VLLIFDAVAKNRRRNLSVLFVALHWNPEFFHNFISFSDFLMFGVCFQSERLGRACPLCISVLGVSLLHRYFAGKILICSLIFSFGII
jgi:hypothetical protein